MMATGTMTPMLILEPELRRAEEFFGVMVGVTAELCLAPSGTSAVMGIVGLIMDIKLLTDDSGL